MRLLDHVAQSTSFLVQQNGHGVIRLPGPERYSARVKSASARFVLMNDVTRSCAEILKEQASLLRSCCDLVRIPAAELWVEWFRGHTCAAGATGASAGQRAGIFVDADEGGRTGILRSFWEDAQHGVVCAPGIARFDLDRPTASAPPCLSGVRALDEIAATADIHYDPEWARYYRHVIADDVAGRRALEDARRALLHDYLMLVSLSLLMSMPRDIARSPVDHARLNASRARAGKTALLDHDEISMSIFPARGLPAQVRGDRAAARLHHVRGHLVRRHDAVFWRRPHMRGSAGLGLAPKRTIRLFLGSDPPRLGL